MYEVCAFNAIPIYYNSRYVIALYGSLTVRICGVQLLSFSFLVFIHASSREHPVYYINCVVVYIAIYSYYISMGI